MKKLFLALLLCVATVSFTSVDAASSIPLAYSLDSSDIDVSSPDFIPLTFAPFTNKSGGAIAQITNDTFSLKPGVYEISFWGQFRADPTQLAQYQVAVKLGDQISWRTRDGVEAGEEKFATTSFFAVLTVKEKQNLQIIARQIQSTATLKILARGLSIKKLQ